MSDLICRKTMRACLTPGMCSPFGGCAAAPPGPVTTFKVDGPGTVTVTATGVRFESSEKVNVSAAPAPTSPTYIVETSADTHAWHPASTHASAEAADRAAQDLMPRLLGIQFVRIRREDAAPAPTSTPVVSTCDDYSECERERDRMRARIAELETAPSAEPSDIPCPQCGAASRPGYVRGVRCDACDGRGTVPAPSAEPTAECTTCGAIVLGVQGVTYGGPNPPAWPDGAREAMRMAVEVLRNVDVAERGERGDDAIYALRVQLEQSGGGR